MSKLINYSTDVLLLFFCLTELVDSSDEDFGYVDAWCRVRSRDLHDLEYILEHHINKQMVVQYNSTTERWTGYTEYGDMSAKLWNNDPDEISRRTFEKNILFPPNVTLWQDGPPSNSTLVCSVHYFYPKDITVTWLRNRQEVTSDVTTTGQLTNGFWSYQIHSHWKYTPTAGDRITCMVEHFSLSEPKLYDWDPSLPESERRKIVIGACVLMLGSVFLAAGLVFRNRSTEWPVETTGAANYATISG